MIDPIEKTIEVPCGQERAFRIFIEEMASWWPMHIFTVSKMKGGEPKGLNVDARQGGLIVEILPDGTEERWGEIRTYDPFGYLAMDFHINHPDYEREAETLVELKFEAIADDRTRVALKQSEFEALGAMAGPASGGYQHGWEMVFVKAYAKACGAAD